MFERSLRQSIVRKAEAMKGKDKARGKAEADNSILRQVMSGDRAHA